MSINSLIGSLFGNKINRDKKEIQPWVERIKQAYPQVEQLQNDELRERVVAIREKIQNFVAPERAQIAELKSQVDDSELEDRELLFSSIDKLEKEIIDRFEIVLDEVLPEVFSIVKETARRFTENEKVVVRANDFDRDLAAKHDFVSIEGDDAIYFNRWQAGGNETIWNMIHYDVQLFGGVVLHKGRIAEMATGEGKTLVATLPMFLNALTGNGVHLITVNDYLSKRDSEWMGPLYMFHGLSVDCIDKHQPNSEARRNAYRADITFGTNNEFGFDYLRDNMAGNPSELVQRGHNFAIVDEVDSVLIDDARTPLIISGPVSKGEDQQFEELRPQVEQLFDAQKRLATQYLADARKKVYSDNDEEKTEGFLALFRSFKALPKNKALIKFLSESGIKVGMLKTEEMFMEQQNRRMPEAVEPLFFVIDEKLNSVDLTDKGVELISGSQNDSSFFVLPDIASELSELENEQNLTNEEKLAKKDELLTNYSIKSERIHTISQLLKAYAMFEKDVEYIVSEEGQVKIVDEQTGRVMEGRRYSDGLHQAIEAKERVKVQAATQTFATITLQNYFRMYHKLAGMTGTAETEAGELWDIYKLDVVVIPTNKPISRLDQNDRIYKSKREKYKAVIEEVAALVEAGRPVLVGTTSVEISEQLSRMLTMRKIEHNVLNAKLHQKEADIVAKAGQRGTVTIATNMAGRGTDIKLSQEVIKSGGLAIVGTERHESRRVDRQLRGRAGRQGDPGSSVFFISLEDNLMRLFGSDRIAPMMDKLGLKDDEMIENSFITKRIEQAQKKVEENHFGTRKRLLEYDDVMNKQRTVVYEKRRHALIGERIGMDIANMIWDRSVNAVENCPDFDTLQLELYKIFAIEVPFAVDKFSSMNQDEMINLVFSAVMDKYKRKCEKMSQIVTPVIKKVFEEQGDRFENILIPVTDGKKMYQIPCSLKLAYETEGKEVVKAFQKAILLHTIDDCWKVNLRELDELKHSVQNASYEQKDPLLIFKLESVTLFDNMVNKINDQTVSVLMRGQIPEPDPAQMREAPAPNRSQRRQYQESKAEIGDPGQKAATSRDTRDQKREPVHVEREPGRNDPCPCGSGKKYKNCHGRGL